jgi:hypothetical protein
MMVALANSTTLLYIMAGTLSLHNVGTHVGGTCANADCALYHDPDTNPQHEYYPLAAMDLTSSPRRNASCVRQVRNRAGLRFLFQ